jgi:hypothetical protein
MSGEAIREKKTQMPLALAWGIPVATWAASNDVPERTAYRWASDPEVRRAADDYRRRAIDMAVGQMSMRSPWAVEGIASLADTARSEAVRLSAYRAILSEMMKVAHHYSVEERIADIDERLRQAEAGRSASGVASNTMDQCEEKLHGAEPTGCGA